MRHVALVASIVLVLADCAGGKEFARPAAEELRLGQTTEQDVRQRMGEPTRTSSTQRNGETMTTLSYGYALAIPYVDDVKTRAMGFYFARGVLVGYEFTSSFPEDKTRFDDSKVSQIKRGETTRQDVIALFGTPGGQYAHPMVTDPAGLALVYLFIDADRHPFGAAVRRRQKLLIVTCDSQGVVRDVQYTTSEVK